MLVVYRQQDYVGALGLNINKPGLVSRGYVVSPYKFKAKLVSNGKIFFALWVLVWSGIDAKY